MKDAMECTARTVGVGQKVGRSPHVAAEGAPRKDELFLLVGRIAHGGNADFLRGKKVNTQQYTAAHKDGRTGNRFGAGATALALRGVYAFFLGGIPRVPAPFSQLQISLQFAPHEVESPCRRPSVEDAAAQLLADASPPRAGGKRRRRIFPWTTLITVRLEGLLSLSNLFVLSSHG